MSEREFGTVKWFNDEKGYGFITRENGEDVFVSSKAIEMPVSKTLKEGRKVSFIAVQTQGGQQADKVRPED